jgi:hypothetical protein
LFNFNQDQEFSKPIKKYRIMKKKILLNLGLILLLAGLFSCEDMVTQPVEQDNFAGLKSYNITSEPLPPPVIPYEYCGEIDLFELWYASLDEGRKSYGTVAIYNDGEKLYIQFDLLQGLEDWSIAKIWLFFGSEFPWEDDGYDPNLDDIDWDDPDMMIIEPGVYDAPLIIEFPIDDLKLDYVLEGCFYLGLKVKLVNNLDGGYSLLPRAYTNLGDRLDDIWMDKICFDECDYPGTGTPGYWKNHPDAWPVDEIDIGGVTYSKEEAIAIMNSAGKGDKTWNLFSQLVAAKLNVVMGNPDGCIADGIMAADDWMAMYGPVWSGVKANSEEWKAIESTFHMLDEYNNGLMCAPKRD